MMTPHPKQLSRVELETELRAAGAIFKGTGMHCLHPEKHSNGDKTPSAGIYQGKDGIFRWGCRACGSGGDVFDVIAFRTGKPLAEILRENVKDRPQTKSTPRPLPQTKPLAFADLDAVYSYLQRLGGKLEALHQYNEQFSIIRWRVSPGRKEMRPLIKQDGGFVMAFPEHRPLYRLDSIAGAETIIVCEGELKADVLSGFGFACTTSSGGSKSAAKTDWRPLAGKSVIIWPDADIPGKQYAADVQRILEGLNPPAAVRIIDPAGLDLKESEDAVDYVRQLQAAGYDDLQIKQNLADVFAKAKSTGPGQEVIQHIAGIVHGKYIPLETGFRCLDDIMQILPGSLNLVCGSPGSSKSLMMIQLARVWHNAGIKTPIYELEKDRTFHLRRALAQESQIAAITNNRWVCENPETAQRAAIEYTDFLDGFGRLIYAMPEKIIYQRDVIDWTKQRADSGCKAVIIDPATKAERQDEPYKADGHFVQQLAQIATMTRLIIFLVLHPSKTLIAMPDLSLIAGGAAYSRFADNAIWLESHDHKTSSVKTCCGTVEETHDRTIWILKSRDGSGTGSRLAFQFNKSNLTLQEIGQIQHRKK